MNTTRPQLKGSVLRGIFRDSKETMGGTAKLMEHVSEEDREAHFASNIFHGMWYEYAALEVLLEAFSKASGHGGASAFQQLGGRMAERDFTTLLKAYALVAGPKRLANVPSKIWTQRFRNAGSAQSEPSDDSFRFSIAGFPGIHPMHCEILTGYGLVVGRQKTKGFTNLHDRCVHRGDQICSWLSTW